MGYIGQPLNAGNLAADVFSGDGSTTGFTLSYSVGSANSISIYIDGVKQAVSTYTASGTTLTFTTAPPSGTNNIEVIFLALEITLPTPGDATVTPAKLTTSGERYLKGKNYVIDGDFTQWPEGTGAVTATDGDYNHALLGTYLSSTGTYTTERSTDVPTFAESGWQSQYSVLVKCTGTDASPSASEHNSLRYHITGYDFASLNQQEVTISFWCKTASANSGDTFSLFLANSAFNRSYVTDFTATNSWAKVSKTVTLDSSGTWLTDEGKGLTIGIGLQVGSTYHGTADTWEGAVDLGTSSTSNFMDSTSNEFYISQFQVVLGDTSPDFIGEPISTLLPQVQYYVERHDYDDTSNEVTGYTGYAASATTMQIDYTYNVRKRVDPTITMSGTGTFSITGASGLLDTTGHTTDPNGGKNSNRLTITVTTGTFSAGEAVSLLRDTTDTAWIMADARH